MGQVGSGDGDRRGGRSVLGPPHRIRLLLRLSIRAISLFKRDIWALERLSPDALRGACGRLFEVARWDENLDECVLCGLCLDAAPDGTVKVIKLYDGGALLEKAA